MKTIVYNILIGGLLGYILFFKLGFSPKETIIKSDTITKIDTIKVIVEKKFDKPKPIKIIDAGGINEVQIYSRPLINDSLGSLTLIDSVQHNQLKGYSIQGFINTICKTKTITNTITTPQTNKVFVGLNFAYTPIINKLAIVPVITLVGKNDYSYSVGYDFLNNSYLVGVAAKIKFRR